MRVKAFLIATAFWVVPQAGVAQDSALFDRALTECVRYIAAKPAEAWAFETPPATLDTDESGVRATVVHPQGSAGNFDMAVSFTHDRGTSTAPGKWACSGVGPKAPAWATFEATGWVSADARLRAAGLVELNFPGPQRAYADCVADAPSTYVLFNAGAGDRVTFAAITGLEAAAFCTSMGWKG
ncbi:MAG: hypothetical protein ABJP79_04105 [Tateyamaria sp.]|uniref:hypothetical protein n=1 Tax=Tateyamaria sp. TaxID=1929288 RepID=UPI0032A12692